MEESRGVYTLPVLYNEQSGRNEGVCVRSELGVVVAIDNEDEFKGVFSKDGEVDVFNTRSVSFQHRTPCIPN